jgi:hypothetical protein
MSKSHVSYVSACIIKETKVSVDKALEEFDINKELADAGNDGSEVEIEVEVVPDGEDDEPYLEITDDDLFASRADPSDEDPEEFYRNLAEEIPEEELTRLADELIDDYDGDAESRSKWLDAYVDGLDLLGLQNEERSEPWEGACGVHHPLLTEAVVKFQSETMMEVFPASGPVRTKIIGKETPAKKESALRVEQDMNHQLTDVMTEYRPEHERLLWGLGLAGNAFKKVYFDPTLDRQTAVYVPAEDLVVPYGAMSLETAERVTHVMRKTENEMRKLQKTGFYRDEDLGEPSDGLEDTEKKIAESMGFSITDDKRYRLLEMHANVDIAGFADTNDEGEETGIGVPYIITIDKGSTKVLSVRRNWDRADPKKLKLNHFTHYQYVPGFGFYAFGLIHLIGAFAKSGTSLIRQLVDAGTLANLPGGFKTRGMRVKNDDTPISPGEFRDVDVASGTMRENIIPLPYKEPSMVLFQLLGTIVDEGRRFAGVADLKVSDMSGQAPVGTVLAILERSMKIQSAVQSRVHASMKQEFKLLKAIIRDYTPDEYTYEPETGTERAKKEDYDTVEVIPVSDPNASTMAQRVTTHQAALQLAAQNPTIYDQKLLHREMLEVLGIKNADKLIPMDEDKKPTDPVTENMDILNTKPVKAFAYQDHQAHIAVHMAATQDPELQALVAQAPNAQAIGAALAAHILEHVAFEYRNRIEASLGVPIPKATEEEPMSEEVELEVSRLAAAAAQKVLAENQQKAQQQKNEQMQQDPLVQMQQKELELKEREQVRKEKQMMIDAATNADRIKLEREKLAQSTESVGLKVGADLAKSQAQLAATQQRDGLQLGMDMAKDIVNRNTAKEGNVGNEQSVPARGDETT